MLSSIAALSSEVETIQAAIDGAVAGDRLIKIARQNKIFGALPIVAEFVAARGAPAGVASMLYRGVVVSIYGLLERTIEDLLEEAASKLTSLFPAREDLPERIVESHYPLALEVLSAMQNGRYSGQASRDSILAALAPGPLPGDPPRLVSEIYSYHTANFRSDLIRACFDRIGLHPLVKVDADPQMIEALDQLFPGTSSWTSIIDELAVRRNEIAHGAVPQQYWNASLLTANLLLVKVFLECVSRSISLELLEIATNRHGQELGKPTKVFKHGGIAGFERVPVALTVGDKLVAIAAHGTSSPTVRTLVVTPPQGSAALVVLRCGALSNVGIGLSNPIRGRNALYRVPAWLQAWSHEAWRP